MKWLDKYTYFTELLMDSHVGCYEMLSCWVLKKVREDKD